ncbi:MAG: metallophosphoesterase [Deltaproteobacteria bacterium]|nr:MAG: metallophosphoesterase [Deltaproteobacteria bacterium]
MLWRDTKKIKLVVSDFHLGYGRLLDDGSVNLMEDFIYDQKFIEFLRYYSSGDYQGHQVELIINGDFFNMLQVDVEGKHPTRITEPISVQVIERIMQGHSEVFDAFREFMESSRHNLAFIIGNHDQGMIWPKVQEAIKEKIAPSDASIAERIKFYPHYYSFDGIWVEHGHHCETLCFFDPKNPGIRLKGTPEPVLDLPWAGYFVIDFLLPMKTERPYIDKIKPFRSYLRWALLNDTRFAITTILRLLIFNLKNRFSLDPHRRKKFSFTWVNIKEASLHNTMERTARNILINTNHHTVILGHNHKVLHKQFLDGKHYFNIGTWNDITSLDVGNLGRATKLTYALVHYNKDKPSVHLKQWHGEYRVEDDVTF